ncbi:ATP synthase delta chain, chloroplastic [Apostasia shenzhenica]|uniref:ATP synthase delta chain, chloroplastic n=1 Tax=Apostasia shenzhenica TaxID=1088818 RepID=A0A2I0A7R8_9ASPA|nr:ATP synthase delta chain, chloroplastic [Apostasia shenzhenica]
MATLRPVSAALLRSVPYTTASYPTNSSLRPSTSPPYLRLRSLKISLPRRRFARGAAGATMVDTAASSYATALADVAKSNNTLDATLADMENLEKIFADNSVQSFFNDPTVTDEKKIELIKEVGASSVLQPYTINFLNILVDMKRIDIIKEIVKEFEAYYNRLTATEVAVVSSVVPLESEHLAQIAKTVQRLTRARNVRIKTVIDPSLIAGFTIRYGSSGSKLIDMSIKKQLAEITARLDFSSITLA